MISKLLGMMSADAGLNFVSSPIHLRVIKPLLTLWRAERCFDSCISHVGHNTGFNCLAADAVLASGRISNAADLWRDTMKYVVEVDLPL